MNTNPLACTNAASLPYQVDVCYYFSQHRFFQRCLAAFSDLANQSTKASLPAVVPALFRGFVSPAADELAVRSPFPSIPTGIIPNSRGSLGRTALAVTEA